MIWHYVLLWRFNKLHRINQKLFSVRCQNSCWWSITFQRRCRPRSTV